MPPFESLAVRLQAVAHLVQQPVHRALAHLAPLLLQCRRQPRRAQARPQQRPRRVAPRRRIHQPFQRLRQTRIPLLRPLPARARRPLPVRRIHPGGKFDMRA